MQHKVRNEESWGSCPPHICLLLSIIGCVSTTMQALAQPPDHLYTPHTGIAHQIPERVTLVPMQLQK